MPADSEGRPDPRDEVDRSDAPDQDRRSGPDGPDLARAALEAARQAARARPAPRRGGGGRGGRATGARKGGYSGPGPDPRDPQPFGGLIEQLVKDRGWEKTAADASVMGRWETLVGPDIAAHCRPESLRDGELVLVAESTAWATQLRLLAPRIVATLRDGLGPGVVKQVRVHGPTAPSWRKGPRHIRGRGPRDTYG